MAVLYFLRKIFTVFTVQTSNFSNSRNNSINPVCDSRWNSKVYLVCGELKPLFNLEVHRKASKMNDKCRDFSIKTEKSTKHKSNKAY